MATTTIPAAGTRRWQQTNESDLFGSIAYSRQLSTDRRGYLTLAERARDIGDEDVDADFTGVPIAAAYKNPNYYVVTSSGTAGKIFELSSSLRTFSEDTSSNVPTALRLGLSEALTFNGKLYVGSSATSTYQLDGSTWTADAIAFGGPMAVFDNLNQLAIGQGNSINTYNTSLAAVVSATNFVPPHYQITTMCHAGNRLYVGTRDTAGLDARLFVWFGTADEGAQEGWSVGTYRINAVVPYKDSVALVDSLGRLLRFNGGGFDVLATFPWYNTRHDWDNDSSVNYGKVLSKGMHVEGDLIFINVQANLNANPAAPRTATFDPRYPSGVWCWDPDVGLHHRYGLGASFRDETSTIATSSVNTTTNVVTVAGATVPETGTPVVYDAGAAGNTAIGGLTTRETYHTINVSSSTLKLAETRALALAGTAIDLTGTGNNDQFLTFLPNGDFGSVSIGGSTTSTTAGFIAPLSGAGVVPFPQDGLRFIFGGRVPKASIGTAKGVICAPATLQENRGHWVSPKVLAQGVDETFAEVAVKYHNVDQAYSAIVVKARAKEIAGVTYPTVGEGTAGGVWASQTSFTTTDDLSAHEAQFDLGVGLEVEVVRGAGAGYLAHVSGIEESGGTYTVTIDETVQNVSAADTMVFVVSNWTKVGVITSADDDGVARFPLALKSKWLQLKLELRGDDTALEEVVVSSRPNRQLERGTGYGNE